MRLVVVALLVGCGPLPTPPGKPQWPTLEAHTDSYNSKIVAIRTTLGRAGIGLEAGGREEVIWSSTCAMEGGDCVRCDLAGETDALDGAALDAIAAAFDRYPTSFLRATGMQHVALCKHIEHVGQQRRQETAGTADIYANRMLLGVESFINKNYDPLAAFTVEDIVHHELYHLLEYDRMRSQYEDDPEWRSQNPAGFEYQTRSEGTRPAGFVDLYAATNEVEDRASTFQFLMARPDELCELMASDAIVKAKLDLIWSRVARIESIDFIKERATCL